jgi:hypothetical protein
MNSKSKQSKQSFRVGYPAHPRFSKDAPQQSLGASKARLQPIVSHRPSATPDPIKKISVVREKTLIEEKIAKGVIKDAGENHSGLNARTPDKLAGNVKRHSVLVPPGSQFVPETKGMVRPNKSQQSQNHSDFKSLRKRDHCKSGLAKDFDLQARKSQHCQPRKNLLNPRLAENYRKGSAHDFSSHPSKDMNPFRQARPLSQKKTVINSKPICAQRHIALGELGHKSGRKNSQPPKSSDNASNKPTPTTQTSMVTSKIKETSQNEGLKNLMIPILRNLDESQVPLMFAKPDGNSTIFTEDKSTRLIHYNLLAKCLCGLRVGERSWFLAVNIFELATIRKAEFAADLETTALASFLVASKFESVRSPDAYEIIHCSGSQSKPKSVLSLEASILLHFDYRVVMTLTYDYYVILSNIVLSQKKARDIGLFMLMIFHCYQTEYQTDKALIAFSLCLFLAQRFREPTFWTRYSKGNSEHYGFKIHNESPRKNIDASEKSLLEFDYSFEAEKVDRTCEKITEACLGCKVEEHSWIFSLFAGDKYKCANG